jgi:hypothetical protein
VNNAITGPREEVEFDNDWDSDPWYGLDYSEEEYVCDDYVGLFDGIVVFDNIRVEEYYNPDDGGVPLGWRAAILIDKLSEAQLSTAASAWSPVSAPYSNSQSPVLGTI